MTCREFADFMLDYLFDELPPESCTRFEGHLHLCTNCPKYLAGYEESVTLGKAAFEADDALLPAELPDEFVRAILAARRSDRAAGPFTTTLEMPAEGIH